MSPSTSITSSVSSSFPASPNNRKRSSPPHHKTNYDEGEEGVSFELLSEAKRVKQQEMLGADLLLEEQQQRQQIKKGQRDSGIVVVVVEAENDKVTTATKRDKEIIESDL